MEYYHSVTVGPTTIIYYDYDIMAPVAAIFTKAQAHRKVFAFRAGNVAIRVKGGGSAYVCVAENSCRSSVDIIVWPRDSHVAAQMLCRFPMSCLLFCAGVEFGTLKKHLVIRTLLAKVASPGLCGSLSSAYDLLFRELHQVVH